MFFKGSPETSWRYVFLCGLVPAAVAFVVRLFVREPERWQRGGRAPARRPRLAELFRPSTGALTCSGFAMAVIALITWWGGNAFIPHRRRRAWRRRRPRPTGLDRAATLALVESWKARATNVFNLGGLSARCSPSRPPRYGAPQDVRHLLRAVGASRSWPPSASTCRPQTRLYMYFLIGLTVFGVFGSFTYYLPELFPTRLRGTGAGFCYNVGRFIAAAARSWSAPSPRAAPNSLADARCGALFWVGFVPLARRRLAARPWSIETKGREQPGRERGALAHGLSPS